MTEISVGFTISWHALRPRSEVAKSYLTTKVILATKELITNTVEVITAILKVISATTKVILVTEELITANLKVMSSKYYKSDLGH